MQYLGGKAKIAKRLAALINDFSPKLYWEPFIGGCNVLPLVNAPVRVGSDVHAPLIALYQALQQGWVPPLTVSEAEYAAARALPDTSPLKGFIGFGCSFSGRWFEGYARNRRGDNFAGQAARALAKVFPLTDAGFVCSSYTDMRFSTSPTVIYCDPPYKGVKPYSGTAAFDVEKFWEWCRKQSETSVVLVSEYEAPADFTCILSIERATGLRTGGSMGNGGEVARRVERVWRYT